MGDMESAEKKSGGMGGIDVSTVVIGLNRPHPMAMGLCEGCGR